MARPLPEHELEAIERAVRARPGVTSTELAEMLGDQVVRRTLQHRLKGLVEGGRLIREGERRWARYRVAEAPPAPAAAVEAVADEAAVPLSPEGQEIRAHLRQPLAARTPVGYNRDFLSAYRPGETFYLSEAARAALQACCRSAIHRRLACVLRLRASAASCRSRD